MAQLNTRFKDEILSLLQVREPNDHLSCNLEFSFFVVVFSAFSLAVTLGFGNILFISVFLVKSLPGLILSLLC